MCERHGTILKLFAPRPGGAPAPAPGEPDFSHSIFVRYLTVQGAAACALEMHGRDCEGRAVCVGFVRDEAFAHIKALPSLGDFS